MTFRTDEFKIGFSPKTETDEACLVVVRPIRGPGFWAMNGELDVLTTYRGKEAEQLYCKLIGVDYDE